MSAALQVHVVAVVVVGGGGGGRRCCRVLRRRRRPEGCCGCGGVVVGQDVGHGVRRRPAAVRRGGSRGRRGRQLSGLVRRRVRVRRVDRAVDMRMVCYSRRSSHSARPRSSSSCRRVYERADLVAEDARDRTDGWNVVLVTDAVGQQPVADLPREDPGVLVLELLDVGHHLWRGDARLAATNGAGQDGAGLVIASQYLGHAAMGHAQLPGDVARPNPQLRQLHDAQPHGVGQRPSVHEHSSQLVDLAILLLALRFCNTIYRKCQSTIRVPG